MSNPSASSSPSRSTPPREPLWLTAALLAIALGVLPILFAALAVQSQQDAAASERYGSTIADRLAASAVTPLLADDLIGLSVLVREYKALEAVATVAIYGADDRLLAAADGSLTSPARLERETLAGTHVTPIRIEDTIAGFARVAVRPMDTGTARGWLIAAAALSSALLLGAGAWLAGRMDHRLALLREEVEGYAGRTARARSHLAALLELGTEVAGERSLPDAGSEPGERQLYVLVVNLFNQISLPAQARSEVLAECESVLDQVCRLYGGRQEALPRTGILVTLDAVSDSGDHAFHAVCAALLAHRVFTDLNRERVRDSQVQLVLRIGLERVLEDAGEERYEDAMALAFPDSVSRGITLSALARDDGIAIGDAVLRSCNEPERLIREALHSPALRTTGDSGHAWLIRDLAPGYRSLLERQAQLLLGAS